MCLNSVISKSFKLQAHQLQKLQCVYQQPLRVEVTAKVTRLSIIRA